MLFKMHILRQIVDGDVTLAFRRWKRSTVKAGGTLKTPVGVLAIEAVTLVDESSLDDDDARQAGFDSKDDLLTLLGTRSGQLYRIELKPSGADPRIELRQQADLTDDDLEDLKIRLARIDSRSRNGPWTLRVLRLIDSNPEVRAADLAEQIDCDKDTFKGNVRKLKNLGLTESLEAGYRISPRGAAYLGAVSHE